MLTYTDTRQGLRTKLTTPTLREEREKKNIQKLHQKPVIKKQLSVRKGKLTNIIIY